MCDLAFINLLREKVRQLEAEDRRTTAFGTTPAQRFVPWVMPAQLRSAATGSFSKAPIE